MKYTKNANDEKTFIVPFIANLNGKTALHLSIKPETGNTRSTEYFLSEFLSKMPFDHHGRAIADCIPPLVESEQSYVA